MIHLYTGNGKGKTTAAFGLAMRNAGWGGRVLVIQFLKGLPSGEVISASKLGIEVRQYGTGKFIRGRVDEKEYEMAEKALEDSREALRSGNYTLVVLDEVCMAVHLEIIKEDDVLNILSERAPSTEVVLTGRYAPESFYKLADYVTEFLDIKNPYARGVTARKGIEF